MSKSKPPISEIDPSTAEAQLRAQVIGLSAREPSPTRAQVALQRRVVLSVVMLVPLLVFMAWGGIRVGPRPERLVLQTALGSAVLAAGLAV
ncbi:MAG TPA: hypothetical protein VER04_25215, partial [Polyangiaceae bacterium]|nr:hypothetical protein [Polyangiaceae bacterium]